MLQVFFLLLFFTIALVICVQDFRERLVSLWVLLAYSAVCIAYVWSQQDIFSLLANALSTLLYFTLILAVLLLYYFIKEKKLINPIDTKIGFADLLLFVAVGLTFDLAELVVFFSVLFFISAFIGLFWFNRKAQTVPLAAILAVCHSIYLLIITLV